MDTPEKEPFPHTPVPLAVLTAIVYVAGFAMVAAWFALLVLGQPAPAAPRGIDASSCSICGVVERVVESDRAGLQLSGDQSEGFVVLLAALGGRLDRLPLPPAPKVYDTAVLHDDGSMRVVREHTAPTWKPGDRVRVIRGRIEPDAAAASQTGRTPSPVPPIARVP